MENRNIQEYSIWKKKIKIFHSLIFLKFFLIKASQHESPKHNNRRKSSCRQKRSFFVKSSPYFFFLLNLTMPNLWIPSRVFWIPCSVNLRMFLLVCVFCCLKKKKPWSKKEKKQKKWAQPFFFLCFFFFFFCLAWIFTSFFVVAMCLCAICIIKEKIIPKKPPTRSQTTFRLFLRESGNQQLHMRTDYNLHECF